MPDWGRGWNTTLRVRDDGTFGDDSGWEGERHGHGRFRDREGHEVRITGRSRDGLEASADLHVTVPAGKNVGLYLGVGKAVVTNVDGVIRVYVASADVAADRTRGTLRVSTGSGNDNLDGGAGKARYEYTFDVEKHASGDILATGSESVDAQAFVGGAEPLQRLASRAAAKQRSRKTSRAALRISLGRACFRRRQRPGGLAPMATL